MWRARRKKDITEEENVSKDLSEAQIANCYYPEDNKTVTIFADSERGKHERTRRRTERTTRTKKRERRQTGKDDERIDWRGTRAADRQKEGWIDAAVHLGTRKKENQTREKEARDKEKDLSGSGHPASPSTPFDTLRLSSPSLLLPRTLVPSLAHSCSTTPSVTTTPIERLLQPRSPRSARFSIASRRVLYKGFIIRSFLLHLYRA